ncbi:MULTISPECIES: tetratricopeptide repeat protein [unclassified Phormidium]|uniref:tetratricopeptide repeat protein n=1 Tax=Cyanophyceae TaxID=3028117 RepID=UPI001683F062|nr:MULTISPECIES: tetratricopeptide repeat protein [unclassified Phormidium]MBD1914373.1 tetratricopeptide repeat protein [Phormidium sp. FACHB-77]MBD2028643.1 tetratricopeptide repeat protein [Phormidium sp. FACHB-322]MBD2053663.1 tetratricopeptide repeat protein [Leptolyngbya sp. FACHB-60]
MGLLALGAVALTQVPNWQWPTFWPQTAYEYSFPDFLDRQGQQTLEQSISFYQGQVQKNPTDGLDQATLANLYIQMARATRNDSWYLLAEKSAQQSLANLPFDNQGAILALAKIAEAQHDFKTAVSLAESVGTPEALGLVITSKLAMGQVSEAQPLTNALAEQYPSLGSLTLKALAHKAQGQDDQALSAFQRAIAAEEPDNPAGSAQTRVFLGRFYAQRGDYKTAQALYDEALKIVPNHPLAHLQLAELATVQGQYRRAKHHYHEVGGPTALHGLARIEALRGRTATEDWNVAETELRRNVEGNALGHRRDLAHLLLERGDPADVAEAVALMETETANRRDAETLDILAWALGAADRLPEAQQVIQEALDQGVRSAAIAYRAGEIESALNHPAQAAEFFRQATAIDPTFTPQTRQRLGLTKQEEL